MREFSVIVASSLIVIFLSVFFIHYTLDRFYTMNEICAVQTGASCTENGMFMMLLFTFMMVMAFIAVIETTIYYIFKEVEMKILMEIRKKGSEDKNVTDLEKRRKDLEKAKSDARKKYFQRKMEESTYNEIRMRYEKELMEVDMKLKDLKSNAKGSG